MKTKKRISNEELEEARKIVKPEEEYVIEKEISLQYNKSKTKKGKQTGQYLIRFPKELEKLLNLQKGMDVKLIVKIPPRHKDEKIKVFMEF